VYLDALASTVEELIHGSLQNVIASDSYNSKTNNGMLSRVNQKVKQSVDTRKTQRSDRLMRSSPNQKRTTAKLAAAPNREAAVTGSNALCLVKWKKHTLERAVNSKTCTKHRHRAVTSSFARRDPTPGL
jgi:hypothetical protein